jgi:hypothetical protein
VYGAYFYREDFNQAGIAGWTGGGGTDGTQYPVSNWANVHIYVDTNSAWTYAPNGTLTAPVIGPFKVPESVTGVRLQASIHVAYVGGPDNTNPCQAYLSGTFAVNGTSTGVNAGEPAASGNGGFGWTVITTAAVAVPATAGGATVKLESGSVYFYASESLSSPTGNVYRIYCDWFRVIDQSGNELYRETTPAVEPIKVWDGSVWK